MRRLSLRPLLAPSLVALSLLLTGCNNACQSLCDRMADYAAECGMSVDPAELDACHEANATPNLAEGALETCATHNDPDALREWWTCSDLAENFTNGAP